MKSINKYHQDIYMKRFAVDVVILPPELVMDSAIEQNRALRKSYATNIVLGKKNYLPHISIAMGCLSEDKLDEAHSVLQSIATTQSTMDLQIADIRTVPGKNKNIVTFDIGLSNDLATFHERVVESFRPLLTQDATEEDFSDPAPIEKSSVNWVNHFIPQQCFDHFWPHITLGFGDPPGTFQPFSFKASCLAICHLGNHCTCKTVLREADLSN
jgi:2'-5' RNA ligase